VTAVISAKAGKRCAVKKRARRPENRFRRPSVAETVAERTESGFSDLYRRGSSLLFHCVVFSLHFSAGLCKQRKLQQGSSSRSQ
jgi:hypothetical protein